MATTSSSKALSAQSNDGIAARSPSAYPGRIGAGGPALVDRPARPRHDVLVRQYLISTESGECPAVHSARLAAVLTPRGFVCERAPGSDLYRLRVGDAEVSFAQAAAGWLVSIEGTFDYEDEVRFINELQYQIETESSAMCVWEQIG